MQPWEAEREVDEALARELIRSQTPVAADHVEFLADGWDNRVYRVDSEWVFRFPRRQLGADLLPVEFRILPGIAGALPVPVAVPVHVGGPTDTFPWPFAGYRYLEGRTACRVNPGEDQRRALAEPLGRFLKTLHALPTDRLDLPGDEFGRMDPERVLRLTEKRLRAVLASPDDLLEGLSDLPAATRAPCLVHGDFYPRQFLLDDDARLTGVIDWGDVHRGDVACDLMVALAFLPEDARPAFAAAYGEIDDVTWRRTRFRTIHHSAAVAHYGKEIGDEDIFRDGLRALRLVRR